MQRMPAFVWGLAKAKDFAQILKSSGSAHHFPRKFRLRKFQFMCGIQDLQDTLTYVHT